jgi:hypothetical protein
MAEQTGETEATYRPPAQVRRMASKQLHRPSTPATPALNCQTLGASKRLRFDCRTLVANKRLHLTIKHLHLTIKPSSPAALPWASRKRHPFLALQVLAMARSVADQAVHPFTQLGELHALRALCAQQLQRLAARQSMAEADRVEAIAQLVLQAR